MPNTDPIPHPLPNRQSIRLPDFDYTRRGAYFITICTERRHCHFGDVRDGMMCLTNAGDIVKACWDDLPAHHARVELDAFQLMPNHVHAVIWLNEAGANTADDPWSVNGTDRRPHGPTAGSIPAIIGSFKSAVSRRINQARGTPGATVWQRDYFEHVVRDDAGLSAIREYIQTNPQRWERDRENPRGTGDDDVEQWVRSLIVPAEGDEGPATQASARPGLARAAPFVGERRATQASPLHSSGSGSAGNERGSTGERRATQASPLHSSGSGSAGNERGSTGERRATQASPLHLSGSGSSGNERESTGGQRATQASPLPSTRGGQAPAIRIGHGYDLHRLQPGGRLMLGGVEVSCDIRPVAHSDGDVVLHAIVDALLGAMGWGDIGEHFANTDPQWKDAPSRVFVDEVFARVLKAGYVLGNVDVTILAERPKLKAFKPSIAAMVSELLQTDVGRVNVKAGTNEGCDAIGRGEAIAAHAVVLLVAGE